MIAKNARRVAIKTNTTEKAFFMESVFVTHSPFIIESKPNGPINKYEQQNSALRLFQ